MVADWVREVEELHDYFEEVFRADRSDLDRLERALADDFTIVSPAGAVADRAQTIGAIEGAVGVNNGLAMSTTDHQLLFESGDTIVGSYIEVHSSPATTRRLSTVVFTRREGAPNGVVWRRVHETWIDPPA